MHTAPLLKVVILGDGNVGKTSLVRRYCEGKFEASRVMTIGVDFQTKVVQLPEVTVKLSIWDVAGQNRFRAVRENMYRGSLAALLVHDLSEPQSLANLPRWREEIEAVVPRIKLILIGNKLDLVQDGTPDGKAYADLIEAPYIKTSALSGEGVEAMFSALASTAYRQFKAALQR